jgi:hypothetical protein
MVGLGGLLASSSISVGDSFGAGSDDGCRWSGAGGFLLEEVLAMFTRA